MKAYYKPSIGLLVLRLVLGIIFIAHGAWKFGLFGGPGLEGSTAFFARLGVPMPEIMAPAVSTVEVVGGLMLIFGILTPLVAAALAIDMLVAILTAKIRGGFFAPNGMEFELALFAGCVALMFAGAGSYSVDAKREGPTGADPILT